MAASRWVKWGVPAGLVLFGALHLSSGDAVGAAALHEHALTVAPRDWSHPIWIDVHREWSRVRPWQSGYDEARRRAAEVAAGRRSVLRD